MAVTYGFYNALNHDRLYDAIQMSSIFDGIIQDGIFSTIGTSMIVTAPEDGMFVDVGPGRAWFNHTWTLNDTEYPVEAEEAEVVLDRIDAVILEVNAAAEVRANSIKFLKGTPSSNPVKPTLTHNAEVNQYALAYVTIRAGQTTIFQSDIENVVGTDETPFVTGLLQQVSVEQLLLQWNDDFYRYFAAFQAHNNAEFNTWMEAKVAEYNEWYAAMEVEGAHDLETFDTWFQHMKDQLDEDAAGHLQAEIDELAEACEKGSVFTVTTEESTLVGRSCVISQGVESVTKQFDANGVAAFPSMPYIGNIHVEATDGDNVAQGSMNIPYFGRYSMSIAFWAATLNISTSADGLISRPITITKGGVVVGTTSFNASGRATYKVHEPGTYIVSSSTAGGDEYSATVVVTEETAYPVNLGIPSGATATPTDDIQTWLKCASIYDKSYTLLADVLEDYYTCERLFSDSNACDYMARSSSWAAVVTTDASVMEQIGKYDYCCSKLLSNATWAQAIDSSSYPEYIFDIRIPKMTSDTTPSGQVFRSRELTQYSTYRAYYPFSKDYYNEDNTNHIGWIPAKDTAPNDYIGYIFTSPVCITDIELYYNRFNDCIFEATNDDWTQQSAQWTKIADLHLEQAPSSSVRSIFHVDNDTEYTTYRFRWDNSPAYDSSPCLYYVALRGRTEPQTDIIHSAAYDTIYYYDANSVERQLCVTDENGNGTVDWSEMEPGIYTFYSTVAKNPDNLSEEYSRTVKITRTTTEVYLMPPNALYWHGYIDENLIDLDEGGYTGSTYDGPTYSANKMVCGPISGKMVGVGTNRKVSLEILNALIQGVTASGGYYGEYIILPEKDVNTTTVYKQLTDGTLHNDVIVNPSPSVMQNIMIDGNAGRCIDVHTLWYRTARELTVFSAANDTIYYLGENNVHIPFAKTDVTGAASVDLDLIPQGTYTLYSTIAKDPDNLSNPYSKQITIGPDTKSIKVMPDNAVYWWGYESANLEDISSANGWASIGNRTYLNPTHNTNSILINGSGTGNCGVGTKNPVSYSEAYAVLKSPSLMDGTGIGIRCGANKQTGWQNGTIVYQRTANTVEKITTTVAMDNGICGVIANGARSGEIYALCV